MWAEPMSVWLLQSKMVCFVMFHGYFMEAAQFHKPAAMAISDPETTPWTPLTFAAAHFTQTTSL
jgi:hypothetical protein